MSVTGVPSASRALTRRFTFQAVADHGGFVLRGRAARRTALSVPCFFILPLWAVAVLLMIALTVATRLVARLRPIYPYALRVLLCSNGGFVVANAFVLSVYVLVGRFAPSASGSAHPALQFGVGVALLAAPIAATIGGVLAGAIVGMWLGHRATTHR